MDGKSAAQTPGKVTAMPSEFTLILKDWQLFFSTVATASVTLAGLLFVSLSLRFERVHMQSMAGMIELASHSFSDFLYVLMLGLIFLVPHPVPFGLAVALFVMGFARGVGLLRYHTKKDSRVDQIRKSGKFLRESVLSGIAAVGLIVVAVMILRGVMTSIFILVLVIAALLTSASWNAWMLLVGENLKED
jgi:hypothetical protein